MNGLKIQTMRFPKKNPYFAVVNHPKSCGMHHQFHVNDEHEYRGNEEHEYHVNAE